MRSDKRNGEESQKLASRASLMTLLMLLITGLAGGECINYRNYLHWTGSVHMPTPGYRRAAISGDFAFIADGASGLQVVDISRPEAPSIVGSADTLQYFHSVVVEGSHAYVTADSSFLVIDIADPCSPRFVTGFDIPDQGTGLAIAWPYVYVGCGSTGLLVIDIANSQQPVIVGIADTPGYAYAVDIEGATAFVGAFQYGLLMIDISDPLNPTIEASLASPSLEYANAVGVSGAYAYVADEYSGLQIVDISSPAALRIVGSIYTGYATDVAISLPNVIVSNWARSVKVVDVSNPAAPSIQGSIGPSGGHTGGTAWGVTARGDYAYVSGYHEFQILDFTMEVSPRIYGQADTPDVAQGVDVAGSIACIADGGSGIHLIDISDPAMPSSIGSFDTEYANAVILCDTLAYVADSHAGLKIINIQDPSAPTLVAAKNTPDSAQGLAISGIYCFVADALSGLQIIDISRPETPSIIGSVDTPGFAYEVAVVDSWAYLADSTRGMMVVDISNPRLPQIVGSVDTADIAGGVAAAFPFVFLTDHLGGLVVIDVSDATLPEIVAILDTPNLALDVALRGTHAYLADGHSGLQVIDITDPRNPWIIGCANSEPGAALGIAAESGFVYVADAPMGLVVFPEQCSMTTAVPHLEFEARPGHGWIEVTWITTPDHDPLSWLVHRSLHLEDGYTPLTATPVAGQSTYKYVDTRVIPGVTYYYLLEALDRTGDREFFGPVSARIEPESGAGLQPTLGQAFPNPVHEGSSTIPFNVASVGSVRIRVLDLAGREIRVLLDEVAGPGERSVTWDGRNGRGEPVPAGIYLYQLVTPGFAASRKLVRLR